MRKSWPHNPCRKRKIQIFPLFYQALFTLIPLRRRKKWSSLSLTSRLKASERNSHKKTQIVYERPNRSLKVDKTSQTNFIQPEPSNWDSRVSWLSSIPNRMVLTSKNLKILFQKIWKILAPYRDPIQTYRTSLSNPSFWKARQAFWPYELENRSSGFTKTRLIREVVWYHKNSY